MKRTILTAVAALVAFGMIATGCLDRKPAPVCPVPIEIATNEVTASQFDGVDLLVVVDNSGSMAEEQLILSTGFFTLINSLTQPLATDPNWGYDAVENMRVAIVSSDLGLMYGEAHETALSPPDTPSCEDIAGDDGNFLLTPVATQNIEVNDGEIRCEQGGEQCPADWDCDLSLDPIDTIGKCVAPGSTTVGCGASVTGEWASTSADQPNAALTTQVACMAMQGTLGCGFEQQLEASLYSLQKHENFMVDSHLLAVLVVSDEEDCSIMSADLFNTQEWGNGTEQNIACNANSKNEGYLFPTTRYFTGFKDLKGGKANAVIFAAIVGVPTAEESVTLGLPLCEGEGDDISGCLDDTNEPMRIVPQEFIDPNSSSPYIHFRPACTRPDPADPTRNVTEARPGRRYVAAAGDFGSNSFVYSICNPDWSPAMESIAEIIARQISSSCYAKKLDWSLIPQNQQPDYCAGNCGEADCDVVVRIPRAIADGEECPDSLYLDVSDTDKRNYLSKKVVVPIENPSTGQITGKNIFCPLPKLPSPKDCTAARSVVPDAVGWYYCEEEGENFLDACKDGNDNDQDGEIDAEDRDCDECLTDPPGPDCNQTKCSYGVEITEKGKSATSSYFITVQCLQRFSFEDENCQEDSPAACYDVKDVNDEDGNGVWNCTEGLEGTHSADPNCCPLKFDGTRCWADIGALRANCNQDMSKHYSADGSGTVTPFEINNSNWMDVPACREAYQANRCTAVRAP